MTGNKSRNQSNDNMHVPAPNTCVADVVNKTPSNLQPELPHRPDPCGQPSESPDSDLRTETFYHGTRSRISSDSEQNKKRKIKYPPSNDPSWVEIQEELAIALPKVFTKHKIKRLNSTDLCVKFQDWVYAFFVEKFGYVDDHKLPKSRIRRCHSVLETYRKRKNECKAALRALKKAGLQDTKEERMIRKEWKFLLKHITKFVVGSEGDKKLEQRGLRKRTSERTPQVRFKSLQGPSEPWRSKVF